MASPIDLTTVSRVRGFLQKQETDTRQDDELARLITAASDLIMRETGRELKPSDGVTRTFTLEPGMSMLDLAPFDLRAVTLATLDTVVMVAGVDYWFGAVDRDGLARHLTFPDRGRWYGTRRVVAITGDWGFERVPPIAEDACIKTVAIWARRDLQAFAGTFSIDENRLERPTALPSSVADALRTLRADVGVG